VIEAQGLTRYYGEFPALRDATFSIGEREIVGFLGLNGAGKSTALRILAGTLLPSAGRVTIGGVDALDRPDAARKRIGFLPEEPPLYREMRVLEFLRWVGQVKGRSKAEVDAALPQVMEQCQLTEVPHRVISELSHGYRKRVGIAQAIIHRPDVVILDEPISGLDPQQIVDMRNVVRSLQKSATVLISSHILSEIALTCDRVLIIHKGAIAYEGSEDELGEALGQGVRITIVLNGRKSAIEEALSGSEHVQGYELTDSEDGHVLARVTLEGDTRERLVADLVKSGLGVRSMQDAVSQLEEKFLELTRVGGTAEALASRQIGVEKKAAAAQEAEPAEDKEDA
jgi:ABC-2 type transport system ATP-binding protein